MGARPTSRRSRRRGLAGSGALIAAVTAALAAAACGGDAGAGDGTDAAVADGPGDASGSLDAPAAGEGTWEAPIVVGALPFSTSGDTRTSHELRAERYDCAPATDERGAEIVYRLDLAAPAIVAFDLTATTPGADVDLQLVRAPAAGATAAGCVTRDDRAMVADLAAGSWWLAVDTYAGASGPAPGAYTLSITLPTSGACLTNPIPECAAGDFADVDGVPTEPPGVGGCPPGMAPVAGFCIDRWEAALVVDDGGGARRGWSPYENPGTASVIAVSAPGIVPQGYIDQVHAGAACARAGKRLCTDAEWLRACRGAANTTYPYGDTREPGVCNDARACHPAVQYFQSSDASVFSMIGHPCLDQLPDGLARTGAHAGCTSADGIYDLMGNLHEWTADPAGTFRGGFFVDTRINGDGCLYVTTAHDVSHWDYSTGFRCCADHP
ncbi:MAG TPA: SUMF1/EgtB/PvdO family nonheme iron enzyme [Kofleriaceae bacterium]|nr:SUMF1/EgtB/PvdO family nonheme iron enzyme [Kofleriaceae bacterium]